MKKLHKITLSLVLALSLVFAMPMTSLANSSQLNSQDELLDYHLEVEEVGKIRTSYVYDDNQTLVTKSIYNIETGDLTTYDYFTGEVFNQNISATDDINEIVAQLGDIEDNDLLASPNYKYVTTHKGTLKYAAFTTVAIAGAITAIVPGASWGAVVALAGDIVSGKFRNLRYTVAIYTASSGHKFYVKRVFKVYNKRTGKKVGPTITGYTTSHHK